MPRQRELRGSWGCEVTGIKRAWLALPEIVHFMAIGLLVLMALPVVFFGLIRWGVFVGDVIFGGRR